jgi:hypothetical protein
MSISNKCLRILSILRHLWRKRVERFQLRERSVHLLRQWVCAFTALLISPGNPYGTVMGQPWVEAVIDLMKRNSTNHNLYFSLYSIRMRN